MLSGAPVTLGVAIAAVLSTLLLGDGRFADAPWLSWLIHTELTHLLTDLVPWVVFGLWLEPRSGSHRWAAWTAAGVVLTQGLHVVTYPEQTAVYGLSAVIYAVAFAGLVQWRNGERTDPRRWVVLALLVALVADELVFGESAWRVAIGDSGRGVRFVEVDHITTVPLLHAAAAVMGALFGLSPTLGGKWRSREVARTADEPRALARR